MILFGVIQSSKTGGGGGATCAYPLDASESELINLGFDGKLTMSNGDQTGEYTIQGGLTSNEQWGAAPTGVGSQEVATYDASIGKKAIETFVNEMGSGTYQDWYSRVFIETADFSKRFEARVYPAADGTFDLWADSTEFMQTKIVDNIDLSLPISIITDADAGTTAVRYDGTDYQVSAIAWTDVIILMSAFEFSGVASEHAGKVIRRTIRTNAANYTGSYETGTTDICGNTI